MAQSFESKNHEKVEPSDLFWGVKIGKRLVSGRLRNNSKVKDVGCWVSLMSLFPTQSKGSLPLREKIRTPTLDII